MTYDLVGLMNANVAEAVEVKAGDSLSTIVQKGCLRLGNYRCPHDPSSTTHGIECMPEVWPLVFTATKDTNALGNVLSAIRSGFGAHQAHIIKQLSLSAESLHHVLTFPAMAITGDITAEKVWTVVEPSIQMSRSLVNYLQGKTPKSVTLPSASLAASATSEAITPSSDQHPTASAIKQMINTAVGQALRSRGHGAHYGEKRGNGGNQRSNSNGGGKRRF